jgi:hypothetical protein
MRLMPMVVLVAERKVELSRGLKTFDTIPMSPAQHAIPIGRREHLKASRIQAYERTHRIALWTNFEHVEQLFT